MPSGRKGAGAARQGLEETQPRAQAPLPGPKGDPFISENFLLSKPSVLSKRRHRLAFTGKMKLRLLPSSVPSQASWGMKAEKEHAPRPLTDGGGSTGLVGDGLPFDHDVCSLPFSLRASRGVFPARLLNRRAWDSRLGADIVARQQEGREGEEQIKQSLWGADPHSMLPQE